MKPIVLFLFIPFTLLTGCASIVGAIIGEREVNNLLGLDGKEVTFGLPETIGSQNDAGEVSPAQFQNIPINVELTDIPIDDLGDLNFPLGATPKSASEELGINGTVTVTSSSPESDFPETLGLANPELDLSVTDDSGAPSVRQQVQSKNVDITFSKTSCQVVEATTACTYQAPEAEYYFFTLSFEGQEFATLFNDILQGGAPTNTASGVVTLFVSATGNNPVPIPLDSSFKLILEMRNGKIDFS
jgi:hypothetical protein